MDAKGVGYGQVFSTAIVATYYLSIMGMTVRYFVDSFRSPLPWSICQPEWGPACTAPMARTVHNLNDTSSIVPTTTLATFLKGNRSSAELYYM